VFSEVKKVFRKPSSGENSEYHHSLINLTTLKLLAHPLFITSNKARYQKYLIVYFQQKGG